MREDFYYPSEGEGLIHACRWSLGKEPKAILQIVHGIAEHVERYDHFARYMTEHGFLVVAEDHMGHGCSGNLPGYFHGGWHTAVEDTHRLLLDTRRRYPNIPYILMGHSMGSFMVRTLLCKYPELPIQAAVISGTAWQPAAAMPLIVRIMDQVCAHFGETLPNEKLQNLVFGTYNAKVEHPRTPLDWVCRVNSVVDEHPMNHGFRPTAGLLRDMMEGVNFIERPGHLAAMRKELPVFFIAGGADPVGNYGKGIDACIRAFRKTGMQDITKRIYPLCRHEILNEINREEVYEDVLQWIESKIG